MGIGGLPDEARKRVVEWINYWGEGRNIVSMTHIAPAAICDLGDDLQCVFDELDRLRGALDSVVNCGDIAAVRIARDALEGRRTPTGDGSPAHREVSP